MHNISSLQRRSMPAAKSNGFSLPELLVVVAIIGLVVAIIIPSISAIRASARTTVCLTNQRQLTQANYSYATDNSGRWTSSRTDDFGTIRVGGQPVANATQHCWVKSQGPNLGGTYPNQWELLPVLEKGTLWPYVGSSQPYLSPDEARNQLQQGDPGPRTRIRSYSFNACLGVTYPEDNPDYVPLFEQPSIGEPNAQTVPIDRYNTTTIATVKQASRMLSTIVEDDTINWSDRSKNLGGWVIAPRPADPRWIDLPAPWNPKAITMTFVDGSTQARPMQNPEILRVLDGPPFPSGYQASGPGPHWVLAPPIDADWRWFRARMNPGVLPNLQNQTMDSD